MKKYEFTKNTMLIQFPCSEKIIESILLYRIKAIRSFGEVEEGDIGGWIEKEENLSHEGLCWIKNNSRVYGNVRVKENGIISENSIVVGEVVVEGDAKVEGESTIFDNVRIKDHSTIIGKSKIGCNARIMNNAMVNTNGEIMGNAELRDNTHINDYASVIGNAIISGTTILQDRVLVGGDSRIHNCIVKNDVCIEGKVDAADCEIAGKTILKGNLKVRKDLCCDIEFNEQKELDIWYLNKKEYELRKKKKFVFFFKIYDLIKKITKLYFKR